MGSPVKCFDVVSGLIEETSSRFSPMLVVNKGKKEILQEYCEALDALAAEFDGKTFEVETDDNKGSISIEMQCEAIAISSKAHAFYELVQRAVSLEFSAVDSENLAIKFVFPSVWDKAD